VCGNEDPDQIQSQGGFDDASAGGGDDLVEGGNGDDHLEGNTGQDTVYGDSGADDILGGDGVSDFVSRLGGSDFVDGGAGDNDDIRDGMEVDSVSGTLIAERPIPDKNILNSHSSATYLSHRPERRSRR